MTVIYYIVIDTLVVCVCPIKWSMFSIPGLLVLEQIFKFDAIVLFSPAWYKLSLTRCFLRVKSSMHGEKGYFN